MSDALLEKIKDINIYISSDDFETLPRGMRELVLRRAEQLASSILLQATFKFVSLSTELSPTRTGKIEDL